MSGTVPLALCFSGTNSPIKNGTENTFITTLFESVYFKEIQV